MAACSNKLCSNNNWNIFKNFGAYHLHFDCRGFPRYQWSFNKLLSIPVVHFQKFLCLNSRIQFDNVTPQTIKISLDRTRIFGLNWQSFNSTAEKQQIVCQSSDKLYAEKSPALFQGVLAMNSIILGIEIMHPCNFFLPKQNKV